jgi:hypothetical protein
MALGDLKKKTDTPLDITVAEAKIEFCELSPHEKDVFELEGVAKWKEHLEKNAEYEDSFESTLKERREQFMVWYTTWCQIRKAGDTMSWDDFYSLGDFYLNEIVIKMQYKMREVHPDYFKRLKEMEDEQSSKLIEMLQRAEKDKKVE